MGVALFGLVSGVGCAGRDRDADLVTLHSDPAVIADGSVTAIDEDGFDAVASEPAVDGRPNGLLVPGQVYGGGQDFDDPDSPGGVLDRMSLGRQAAVAEARELVEQAKARVLAGELEMAEELLERAVNADPQNEDASLDLAEVRQLLGDGRGEMQNVARSVFELERLSRERTRAEIRHAINLGINHKEIGEYDAAVTQFKNAIDMVRSEPFDLRLDDELAKTQQLLEQTEQLRDEQAERDRRELQSMIDTTMQDELGNSMEYLENQIRELHRRAKRAMEADEFDRAVSPLPRDPQPLPSRRSRVARTANREGHGSQATRWIA